MDIELMIHRLKGQADKLAIRYTKAKDTVEAEPIQMEFKTIELKGVFDEDGDQVKSAIMIPVDPDEIEQDQKQYFEMPKYLEDRQLIEEAWISSGMELLHDNPYITRSALREYMIKNTELSTTTINNKLKPSRKYGIIHGLIENHEVSEAGAGYILNGLMTASIMKVLKNGGITGL